MRLAHVAFTDGSLTEDVNKTKEMVIRHLRAGGTVMGLWSRELRLVKASEVLMGEYRINRYVETVRLVDAIRVRKADGEVLAIAVADVIRVSLRNE